MTYLDSFALLKLLHEEQESAALEGWISEHEDTALVSSELARIEVVRACRRVNADALPAARALLAGIDLVPLSGDIVGQAAEVGDASHRSVDAIHLASALALRAELSAFVAYDRRLNEAASSTALTTMSPGA